MFQIGQLIHDLGLDEGQISLLVNYKVVNEIFYQFQNNDKVPRGSLGKKRLSREFKVRLSGGDLSEKTYDIYQLTDQEFDKV